MLLCVVEEKGYREAMARVCLLEVGWLRCWLAVHGVGRGGLSCLCVINIRLDIMIRIIRRLGHKKKYLRLLYSCVTLYKMFKFQRQSPTVKLYLHHCT